MLFNMRSLFILLLVINIAYLVWGVAFSEKKDAYPTVVKPKGVQTLTLLSEAQELNTSQVNVSEKKAKPDKLIDKQETKQSSLFTRNCYSLGPILDDNNLKKLEQKLKQNGIPTKLKSITDKEPKSYWVYFPPEKSLGDAKAVVNQLSIAGVEDYFIVREGKFTHAISMGLYNSYNRAKIRLRKLKKLGFNARVETRYHDVTRHWLDFQETTENVLKDSVWNKLDEENPLQKIVRPCVDPLPGTS